MRSASTGPLRYFKYPEVIAAVWIAAISLSAVLAVLVGIWKPAHDRVLELSGRLQVLVHASETAHDRQAIATAYHKGAELEARFRDGFYSPGTQSMLVRFLSDTAQATDTRVVSEAFEESDIQEGYRGLYVALQVRGRYPDLRRFLAELYRFPVRLFVDRATLGSAQSQNEQEMELRLVAYRQKQNQTNSGGGRM